MSQSGAADNPYAPMPVEVLLATRETADVETFRLEPAGAGGRFQFVPGQFVVLSILGVGECPMSLSSSPTDGPWIDLTVRKVGRVTAALYGGPPAGALGLRGPFGRGFDIQGLRGRPLVCLAGGIGLASLRSLIRFVNAARLDFGPMTIVYGAATPADRLYKNELEAWQLVPGNKVAQIVEADPQREWRGPQGTVVELLDELDGGLAGAAAVLCGPPDMFRPVVCALRKRGMADGDILLALERRMSCGLGKCGHCYVGEKLVCLDGPIFTVGELRRLGERL